MAAVYIKSALFLAIALSLIMGSTAVLLPGSPLATLNPTTIQIAGRVVCSTDGNTVPGVPPVGLGNVNAFLRCGNASTNVSQVTTDPAGFILFVINALEALLFDPSICTVNVPLPLANCTVSLPTGTLQAVPSLVGTVGSTANLTANFILSLFDVLTGDN